MRRALRTCRAGSRAFRDGAARPAGGRREGEARVLVQDVAFQPLELGARVQPEAVPQDVAEVLVDRQRLALAAAPVERQHQQAAQPLARGLLVDQRRHLADQLVVAAEGEFGLEAVLQRGEPRLLQRRQLGPRGDGVDDVGQRGAAPQREGLAQAPGRGLPRLRAEVGAAPFHQRAETGGVDEAGVEAEQVSGRGGLQRAGAVGGERAAHSGDGVLHHLARGGGHGIVPEGADEVAGGHHGPGVQEQVAQDRALVDPSERDGPAVPHHLQRTEQAESQGGPPVDRLVLAGISY
nr:hypothetical protein [Actinomadura montaniterrae]